MVVDGRGTAAGLGSPDRSRDPGRRHDNRPGRGIGVGIGIGIGIGLCFATIPAVALGDAKPDEAGSAGGSLSSIQQLASAAVTSIFFHAAASGLAHAMKVSLIVVLAVTVLSLPIVALMPRTAPPEPRQ
ncbi:hypothetical protein ACPPVO_19890 [Dactylosporangium sp. McL0621]|uniref:hypothetical protein n=1 Tax=Dactylosporangium sp. McL0621 TaxID=3415678 RepID=UPI003CED16EE